MASVLERVPSSTVGGTGVRVVLSGSFRRDVDGLRVAFDTLRSLGCSVLSPGSVDFVEEIDGFALTADEAGGDPAQIEALHIAAIRAADFVWLHAPDGYVGPSAALEIGVAHSLDVPVLALEGPTDTALASFVVEVSSIADAIGRARAAGLRTPVAPLRHLQAYYERVAEDRGFDQESAQDTMLLLTEEVGELARAVRKSLGLARSGMEHTDAAEELADVQLYLLHLANVVGVDLATAVRDKERLNDQRYGRRAAA